MTPEVVDEDGSARIPYGRQHVDSEDVAAVTAVLTSDWLTQGPAVEEFERHLATYCEVEHAVAFSSGTAALHAAAAAAELGPGKRLYTSPLSFAASAACAIYVGASAGFVDIDGSTLNIDLQVCPPDADAIVPVHYAGLPVDLRRLPESARRATVIEDAAHAIGSHTSDGPVGNCARSDMCAFSFHPVKTVTSAEGGAVTTNDASLAESLRRFRSHGVVSRPEYGAWYYEIPSVGMNYRLSDVHAALGTSQIGKLDRFVRRRNEIASRYRDMLKGLPVDPPPEAPPRVAHAYHLFPIQVAPDVRRAVFEHLRAAGIGVQVHYVPIYRHPAYGGGADPASFPQTERAYEGLISLPIYADLRDDDQDRVIRELTLALNV